MTFLADTNVLSEMRKRQRMASGVRSWVASIGWNALSTSWVVIGEMKHGANLIARRDSEQAEALNAWINYVVSKLEARIYPVDGPVAEIWAKLGIPNPLPATDALIAATAINYGLTLATRNVRDFTGTGVQVFDPWSFKG
jgi:predicted nucleic acid-binding protein